MLKIIKSEEFATARHLVAALDGNPEAKAQLLGLLSRCETNNAALASQLISSSRLKNMIFGRRTEHLGPTLFEQTEVIIGDDVPPLEPREPDESSPKPRRTGRRNLRLHAQVEVVRCSCEEIASGDSCPSCRTSNVHASQPQQKTVVQCVNLVVTQVFEIESLRCRSCGYSETAPVPEIVNECIGKYHFSAVAQLAVLRYHGGLPSHRMESLTGMLGLSVPETTQFRLFQEAARLLRPIVVQIKNAIANSAVSFRDDSPMRILKIDPETNIRKSVTVTTLVGLHEGKKYILYETSTFHAGEVYGKIMARQSSTAPPQLAMSDALSANHKHEAKNVHTLSCLVHARRNFYELMKVEPEETALPLKIIAKVYANDAKFKDLSPAARLAQHQEQSEPLMKELLEFCQKGLYRRGKNEEITLAFGYVHRHWERLTGFLKFEGAPLDNNEAERTLKRAIRYRRNSLFYKTENGAAVGDVLMSLIATLVANNRNPIALLTEALRKASRGLPPEPLFQI